MNTSTMSGIYVITRSSLLPAMWVGQQTNCSQPDRFQKSRVSCPYRSVGETNSNHSVISICITNKKKDCFIINWLYPSHRVKETVIKWTVMSSVVVKSINIKIVYHTANTKHTVFMAKTLQLALPEGVESFLIIKSHTLGSWQQEWSSAAAVGCNESQGYGALREGAIRDFRLGSNQNIIRSSHSQLVQIGMKIMNVGIEDPNSKSAPGPGFDSTSP